MVECQNGITILSRTCTFFISKVVMNRFIIIAESMKLFQLQNKTPTENTGPERAKGGKYYMYIETSTMKSEGNARLMSSLLTTGSLYLSHTCTKSLPSDRMLLVLLITTIPVFHCILFNSF